VSIEEWIPTYLCYGGYKRMLATIYRMEAEKRPVTVDGLAEEMELMRRSAKAGLIFLKGIDVVEVVGHSWKLTPQGLEYAHAVSRGSKDRVRKVAYGLLSKSRFENIIKYLETNSSNLTVKMMYDCVRREARIPGTRGPFGVKPDHATGIDSLLHILQSAGVIPESINLEAALGQEFARSEKSRIAANSEA
jgi:hypothetical protein